MALRDVFLIREEKIELSDSFWSWFGDSKVIGRDGEPLVVFHGTDSLADFPSFKMGMQDIGAFFGSAETAAARLMNTQAGGLARSRRQGREPYSTKSRVVPVYLSIQNPIIMRDQGYGRWTGWAELLSSPENQGLFTPEEEESLRQMRPRQVVQFLKSKGYDGAYYPDKRAEGYFYSASNDMKTRAYKQDKSWRKSVRKDAAHAKKLGYGEPLNPGKEPTVDGERVVWIPFSPGQIKSVFNAGEWNREDRDVSK